MSKDIEMNYKGGQEYEVIYPSITARNIISFEGPNPLLTASTAAIYGLDETAVPDDIFVILGLGAGKYGYGITILYPDGTPASNLSVTGVTDRLGEAIITDENGYFLAVSEEQSITFSINQNYFDIQNISNKQISSTGVLTKQTIQFEYKDIGEDGYILITDSQTISFSKKYSLDVTGVGGGGGTVGASSAQITSYGFLSAGGGGGFVSTKLSNIVEKGDMISIVIGSGGTNTVMQGGTPAGMWGGGTGGATSVSQNSIQLISANGGNGGQGYLDARGNSGNVGTVNGGSGNGKGGTSIIETVYTNGTVENGVDATGYIFNESSLGLAGGGGGGGGPVRQTSSQSSPYLNGLGGAPYGARGGLFDGSRSLQLYSPTGIGGGAGGSMGNSNVTGNPGNGAAGGVYIRYY